jgi:hypothetical protein
MKTPGGWATSHMLYDKTPGPPPPGSPLESIFLLVHLERTETTLLSTRAMIQALLPLSKKEQDPAIKAYEAYHARMMPFLEKARSSEITADVERLKSFTKTAARIDLRPVHKARVDAARKKQRRSFKITPSLPGRQHYPSPKKT